MIIVYASSFKKQIRHLPPGIKRALSERLRLFVDMPYHPLLDNHVLKGDRRGYRSINITGDWRVIYEYVDATNVRLIEIGTHHDLYGT
ncbi:hypothetical protein A3G63_02525 [Candidatus Kaiserbacteria bacterium RIFCSPLOWO2_12_FULL_52_8]|uniref:Addiction module toxin RelE n=1 Tax=Candidatus Kaiserbacteria bacterium RIFCSPHIGHO2_01_FULL_53_31 TaxID=1798481 RepID=A0A1F6CH96_9BACT|nr:MAG: hypothetical protein A2678_03095 [Candidatus Kaiserbacteria bacterium RIFCSPHIGHO2_01_FULL_53_31]OGG92549.1 MAG: hypothetical protein A3G63_02525 [Candidatus Kaiserbacteria bacterium RIFCSPLOWO2_12_FULL_52_8]